MNKLFYGDNLAVLRESIKDESIDLIYLDPPFNSNATYNVLFRSPKGLQSEAQIEVFEDTWHWDNHAELAFSEVEDSGNTDTASILRAFRSFLGENDMMAYLSMMSVRLIELSRVLKPSGSLYLHCDPTASHYLKIILDGVFGKDRFGSEIVWKRYGAHSNSHMFGAVHDIIFFYNKGSACTFNKQYTRYEDEYIKERFKFTDPDGRRWAEQNLGNPAIRRNLMYSFKAKNGITYDPPSNGWKYSLDRMSTLDIENKLHYPKKVDGRLRLKSYQDELQGIQLQDVWTDLVTIGGTSSERLGYPTQKPLALLERIVSISSNEDSVVLDPFCGCGTAVHAAQKLGRKWIGIDITHLAIGLIERRLKDAFPAISFEVHGTPKDLEGARDLAMRDKYQFQWWATSLVGAVPAGGKRKGMDRGIDGYISFRDAEMKPQVAIVSVKGGENVGAAMIRDLKGTMAREKSPMGVFISLTGATREMLKEAASAGFYETGGLRYQRIQIVTIEQLLAGEKVDRPFGFSEGFKKTARDVDDRQPRLL